MIVQANWQCFQLDVSTTPVWRVKRRTTGQPTVFASGTDKPNKDSWTAPNSPTPAPPPDYYCAFWSLTAQDTTPGSTQQVALVQQGSNAGISCSGGDAWIVTANAYFIPLFGPGVHGPGNPFVWIDAFDIQLGDFIPDDFVDVKPDPMGTLTVEANNGYIDTATDIAAGNPITIAARDTLHNKQFAYWQPEQVIGSATVGSPDRHDIVANNNDLVVAFSFYNEVPPGPPLNIVDWNPWAYILTGFGTVPPIGPRGPIDPWVVEVAGALTLGVAAKSVTPQLQKEVLEIAQKQLQLGAGTLKKQLNSSEG